MKYFTIACTLFLCGCSYNWKPKKQDPDWYKYLTPAAITELKALPDCVYFIDKKGKITSHCN